MKLGISTLFFFSLLAACTSTDNTSSAAMEIYSTDCQNWSSIKPNIGAYFTKPRISNVLNIKYSVHDLNDISTLTVTQDSYTFATGSNDRMYSFDSGGFVTFTDFTSKPQVNWGLQYIPNSDEWIAIGSNIPNPPYLVCTKKGCTFSPDKSASINKLNKHNVQLLKMQQIISRSSLNTVSNGIKFLMNDRIQNSVEGIKSLFHEKCSITPSGYKLSEVAESLNKIQKIIVPTLDKYVK
jgi:hypothetical protein